MFCTSFCGLRAALRPVIGIMAMTAGMWLTVAVRAVAQTPPWQEPPCSEAFNSWASGSDCNAGPTCSEGPGCPCGASGPCCDGAAGCGASCGLGWTFPHDNWARFDALFWWTRGGNIPPLLTTSPDATPQNLAGVLGQLTTTILLGNQSSMTVFAPAAAFLSGPGWTNATISASRSIIWRSARASTSSRSPAAGVRSWLAHFSTSTTTPKLPT